MAVILPFEDLEKQIKNSGYYWSDADWALARENPQAGWQIYNAKKDYANATTDAARALANASAESVRSQYGSYTGGRAGDEYNPFGGSNGASNSIPFNGITNDWASAGNNAWNSVQNYGEWNHSDAYNNAYANALDYGPFRYDYKSDPLYSVYAKEYTREGQRAQADALAQAAAMTGGVPSSYANTAAQQAGNYYAAQLADKIPELRQQAYNEYNQNFQNLLAKYNAAYQGDAFDYGVWGDQYNRLLGQMDRAYDRYDTELGQALDQAALQAKLGDMSGYDSIYGTSLQGLYDDANAVYAFSDDGGEPYKISSALGLNYLNTLPEGGSVTGGDGSTWTRQNGQVVITDANGRTYRYGEAKPTYGGIPAPKVENRYQHVYDTIMNEVTNGGSINNVWSMVGQEIAQARKTGSMTDEQIDKLLKMYGY